MEQTGRAKPRLRPPGTRRLAPVQTYAAAEATAWDEIERVHEELHEVRGAPGSQGWHSRVLIPRLACPALVPGM